jgi:hypothetical protein
VCIHTCFGTKFFTISQNVTHIVTTWSRNFSAPCTCKRIQAIHPHKTCPWMFIASIHNS